MFTSCHLVNSLTGGEGGGGAYIYICFQLNEEAGYKSAFAGSNFRDFAWHLKWSREEKKLLSLSHYKPLPIHIFIGLTVQKSKKKYP